MNGEKKAEFFRYLLVGGINTGATYLIYLGGLFIFSAPPIWAYNFSFAAGIFISYFLNLKITFRRSHHWRKLVKFPLVYAAQYIAGALALQFFLSLEIPAAVAGLLILPLVVPLGFVLSRFFLR